MNNKYDLQFEKLCTSLDLGELTKSPVPVTGGLMHKMYLIETSKGKYAVKLLNPSIMARTTAYNNYVYSEKIVEILAKHIPAVSAHVHQGVFLHKIGTQFYMIFDWIEGETLTSSEITISQCNEIGNILGRIHKVDFPRKTNKTETCKSKDQIDWNFYLAKGKELNSEWVNQLSIYLDQLITWNIKAISSFLDFASESVISHRDLEPKNVMWKQGKPIIIDWESAGEINPKHDLIETAIYWSINKLNCIDQSKFYTFINGYQEHCERLDADWMKVLELGYLNKLEWLEYSLKRSLYIECSDENEQKMGTKHVMDTINELKQYEKNSAILLKWLNNI